MTIIKEFDFCKFSESINEIRKLKEAQDYIENHRDDTQPFMISATSSGSKENSPIPFLFKFNKDKGSMTKDEEVYVQIENTLQSGCELDGSDLEKWGGLRIYIGEYKSLEFDHLDFEYPNEKKDAMEKIKTITDDEKNEVIYALINHIINR